MPSVLFNFSAILLLMTGRAANVQDTWSVLENRHVIISHIEISILPVFNLQNPKENHFIARGANFIHIESQENSIRPALLFKEGEPVNGLRIHASERLLRRLPFVRDAEIIPLENPDSTVTAIVRVRDAWSLKLSLALSYVGSESEWSAMVREFNFLGLGKQIQIGYKKTIERTLMDFAYKDPFFFNTRWIMFAEYQRLSDGTAQYGMLNHPFYDVYTPWAAGIMANSCTRIHTFYEKGEPVYDLPSHQYLYSLFYQFLVWRHNNAAQRLGLECRATGSRYDSLTILKPDGLPFFDSQNRRFQGFMGFWEFFQDDHIVRRNVNFIDKVEDFNLGLDVQVRMGYFPKSLGSSKRAVGTEGSIEKGITVDKNSFFLGNILWHGMSEEGRVKHMWSQFSINFFDQHLPRQTCMISIQFIQSVHPVPEDVTYLGGTDGLRGYMNYFRIGDERWMVTVEDRVFTSWNFLGLVELGFVSYIDLGGVKELSTGRWSKSYASAGAGLRIGNLKSSFGRVMSLTVATPIVREPGVKGIQIVLGIRE